MSLLESEDALVTSQTPLLLPSPPASMTSPLRDQLVRSPSSNCAPWSSVIRQYKKWVPCHSADTPVSACFCTCSSPSRSLESSFKVRFKVTCSAEAFQVQQGHLGGPFFFLLCHFVLNCIIRRNITLYLYLRFLINLTLPQLPPPPLIGKIFQGQRLCLIWFSSTYLSAWHLLIF